MRSATLAVRTPNRRVLRFLPRDRTGGKTARTAAQADATGFATIGKGMQSTLETVPETSP